MSDTHRLIGQVWWQKVVYPPGPGIPWTERGNSQETVDPWRFGACRIFRVWGRYAVAVGRWDGFYPAETDPATGERYVTMRPLQDWESYVRHEGQDGGGEPSSDLATGRS